MTLSTGPGGEVGVRSALRYPARIVPLAFLAAIVLGTGLMMLPAARTADAPAPFVTALFTATSSVCVTGLSVVDTHRHTGRVSGSSC